MCVCICVEVLAFMLCVCFCMLASLCVYPHSCACVCSVCAVYVHYSGGCICCSLHLCYSLKVRRFLTCSCVSVNVCWCVSDLWLCVMFASVSVNVFILSLCKYVGTVGNIHSLCMLNISKVIV